MYVKFLEIKFFALGVDIRLYSMYDLSGELNVILIVYMVVAKGRKRLAVSKRAAQKCDVERFNLRKLNELEVRKQYQIRSSKSFAALENLNDRGHKYGLGEH